jgi:hypothetical protein
MTAAHSDQPPLPPTAVAAPISNPVSNPSVVAIHMEQPHDQPQDITPAGASAGDPANTAENVDVRVYCLINR